MTTISSKHVLITGSASGIGRLLAEKMSALGAHVSMWDMDETCLAGAAAGITRRRRRGARVLLRRERPRGREPLAAQTMAEGGPVDILVNNAGIVSGRAAARAHAGADRAHDQGQRAGPLLGDPRLPAGDDRARQRPHRHRRLRRRAHRRPAADRLRRQQVRRRRLRRVAAHGAAPLGPRRDDHGGLPVLHRHRHVRRGDARASRCCCRSSRRRRWPTPSCAPSS